MSASAIGRNPTSESAKRFSINNSSWATLQGYMVRFAGENIPLEFVEYEDGQGFFEAEVSAEETRAIADRLHLALESGEVRSTLQADVEKEKARTTPASTDSDPFGRDWLYFSEIEYLDVDSWEKVLGEWAEFLRDCGGCSVSQ